MCSVSALLCFTVDDDGPGIWLSAPRMFERGVQLDQRHPVRAWVWTSCALSGRDHMAAASKLWSPLGEVCVCGYTCRPEAGTEV